MMNTKTAKKEDIEVAAPAESKGDVAVFQPPRLPYHHAIKARFNVDPSGWKALVEAVYPNARSVDSVVMALSYCKARNLDPFKRPVHIVPMWDQRRSGYVETIWPGIAELRTTAFRTGQYAGCDEAEFGPVIEHTFKGSVKNKKKNAWEDKEIKLRFPEWCRITVYRGLAGGGVGKFVGPKAIWLETYAAIGASELPNDMWEGRSEGQLEKCAEAAALRKAFPEELGNQLTAEEMAGRVIRDDHAEENIPRTAADEPPEPAASAPPAKSDLDLVEAGIAEPGEVIWEDPPAPAEAEADNAEAEADDKKVDKVAPHKIVFPADDWIAFGQQMIAAVTASKDAAEAERWLGLNRNTFAHMQNKAPKVYDRMVKAIGAAKAKMAQPKPADDPEAYLTWLTNQCAEAKDAAALKRIEEGQADALKGAFPPDREAAAKIIAERLAAIEKVVSK